MILAMLFIRTANIANEKRKSKGANKKKETDGLLFLENSKSLFAQNHLFGDTHSIKSNGIEVNT